MVLDGAGVVLDRPERETGDADATWLFHRCWVAFSGLGLSGLWIDNSSPKGICKEQKK